MRGAGNLTNQFLAPHQAHPSEHQAYQYLIAQMGELGAVQEVMNLVLWFEVMTSVLMVIFMSEA